MELFLGYVPPRSPVTRASHRWSELRAADRRLLRMPYLDHSVVMQMRNKSAGRATLGGRVRSATTRLGTPETCCSWPQHRHQRQTWQLWRAEIFCHIPLGLILFFLLLGALERLGTIFRKIQRRRPALVRPKIACNSPFTRVRCRRCIITAAFSMRPREQPFRKCVENSIRAAGHEKSSEIFRKWARTFNFAPAH